MPNNNIYSTSPFINDGTTAPTVFTFGLIPRYLRVYNPSAVDIFAALDGTPSTGPGGGILVKAGGEFVISLVPCPIASVGLTSTTTVAGTTRASVLAISG